MNDHGKFQQAMMAICERYEKTPSEILLESVWEALRPYNDDVCVDALKHVFLRCRFFNQIIPDLMERIEGKTGTTDKMAAEAQADAIVQAIKLYGSDYALEHITDTTSRYLMKGRWSMQHVGMLPPKEMKWWRRDFVEAYIDNTNVKILTHNPGGGGGAITDGQAKKLLAEVGGEDIGRITE